METLSGKTIAMLRALLETAEHKDGIGGSVVVSPAALNKVVDPKAMGPFWDKDVLKEGTAWCEKEGFPLLPVAISVADDMPMQNREISKMASAAAPLSPAALKDFWKAEVARIESMDEMAIQAVRERLQEIEDTANASKKTGSRRALVNARVQNVDVSDFETEYAFFCKVATDYATLLEKAPEQVPDQVSLCESRLNKNEEGYKDDIWEKFKGILDVALQKYPSEDGRLVDAIEETMKDNLANWITKRFGGADVKGALEKRPDGVKRFEQEAYDFYMGKSTAEHFFNAAQDMLGGQYPIIAHLMFLKDKEQFVPVKPTYFEAGLKRLGIEFYLSGCCSWDNYKKFLGYLEQMRQQLVAKGEAPTLLDAHSFLWYVGSGYWRDGEGAKKLEEARKSLKE